VNWTSHVPVASNFKYPSNVPKVILHFLQLGGETLGDKGQVANERESYENRSPPLHDLSQNDGVGAFLNKDFQSKHSMAFVKRTSVTWRGKGGQKKVALRLQQYIWKLKDKSIFILSVQLFCFNLWKL
jgi:hypothetical protein